MRQQHLTSSQHTARWQWWSGCFGSSRHVSSLWHSWSFHFVTAFAPHLRHRRYSSRVVSVVSLLQHAVRTPRPQQVVGHLSGLWCAPRIRLVRPVHRRSADGDRKLRIITTHVRRRHTGVRFVSSVCCEHFHGKGFWVRWSNHILDEI